jgi:predicted alpha/beta hydrolase
MKSFTLAARDDYPLGVTLYGALESSKHTRLVLMAGATGVPQGFYRRFAEFLAARGHAVLTLDYRGIGRSKHGSLRGFQADYLDWAGKDLSAVLSWAVERARTFVVGHSFGGHAFGLLPDANATAGLWTFGTGAGWHGHMPLREQPKVLAMWNLLGPAATGVFGYLPSRYFGLGEDLPLGVYRQWKRWCRYPRYFFDDAQAPVRAPFDAVTVPVRGTNSLDDAWAPPASARAFLEGYRNAKLSLEELAPRALGLRGIGHMGYFRPPAGAQLWPRVADWVEGRADLAALAASRAAPPQPSL